MSLPTAAATMRDVAAVAGVSIKTVSRVVNGEGGVREHLVTKVMAAVDMLDYRHNLAASSLRRSDGRSATIGLIVDDVSNPFAAGLQRAVEDFARARSTLVLAGSSDLDRTRERELVRAFSSRRVDGLIVMTINDDQSELAQVRRMGTPVVFIDREPTLSAADSVTVDNAGAAMQVVGHLAAGGHRRIAHIGDSAQVSTARERRDGYVEGLGRHHLTVDPSLVRMGVHTVETAVSTVADLMSAPDPPTALFTGNNLLTTGAVRELQRRRLHRRVALVGFDDFLMADLLDPGVTVIAQDLTELGRAAAELLFARMNGSQTPAAHVVVRHELIARGSGEIPHPIARRK